eukprot:TRINITY_DN28470_c0_g1_i1.p1 TRINITY_DN28470_c0_g1~~TRINITY_DN28470_c0_g1_i1.p1  ORF type:complete len:537 (+),score=96.92 TRINITY_DN28470_c0_g1_i1:125-1735(+)
MGAGESELGDFIDGPWPVVISWFCFFVVSFSTTLNAYRHLLSYSRPDLQPHVLRIIVVGPIYALSGALCLSSAGACFFVRTVRDIWEAVVIYSFLTLIVEYMGGEHLCLHSISQREEAVPHMFPLNFCFPPIPTSSMIRIPKIGALQFVIAKPIVAVVSIIAYMADVYETPYYQWSLFFVYNVSYSIALYALYLIYGSTHDHQALNGKRPLLKFLSVKMIIFLTYFQAYLLPVAPLPGEPSHWEDLILALEMVIFGLLMNAAFSWREFHSGLRSGTDDLPKALTDIDSIDLMNLEQGTAAAAAGEQTTGATSTPNLPPSPKSAAKPRATTSANAKAVVLNAGNAFCPKDILDDASHNFSRRYQKHVLIECAQEYELGLSANGGQENHSVDLLAELSQDATAATAAAETAAADGDHARQRSLSAVSSGAVRKFRARTYLIGKSISATGKEDGDAARRDSGCCPAEAIGASGSQDRSEDRALPTLPPRNAAHGPPQVVNDWRDPPLEQETDHESLPEDFSYEASLSANADAGRGLSRC